KEVLRLHGRHPRGVRAVTFTPDGKAILVAGQSGIARYDVASGQRVWSVDERLQDLTTFTFSSDGKVGFSGRGRVEGGRGWPPDLDLWDTVKGQRLRRLVVNDKYSGGYLPKQP